MIHDLQQGTAQHYEGSGQLEEFACGSFRTLQDPHEPPESDILQGTTEVDRLTGELDNETPGLRLCD
jgi:hypothetical protein